MRADFVSIWLMVDYVYGHVTENASEMNVSLNVTVGRGGASVMLWGAITWRRQVERFRDECVLERDRW